MSYQIELRHLKYFQSLATELNFRKAAEKLFVSQPGLSRQIKQMEEIYGATLFDRTKRRVELTEAGQYLKTEVDFIFSHLEHIQSQIFNIHEGNQSELRIGFLGSAAQKAVPAFVTGLNKAHPGIRTALDEMPNRMQIELLLSHQLDLGFVRMQSFPDGISKHLVHQDTFSLVVPKDYALKQANAASIQKLSQEPFIFFSSTDSPYYHDLIMSICEDHGFHPKVFHKSINALTIYKLIEEGMGIAILPTSLQLGYELNVRFIELKHIPQRTELYAVWSERNRNPSLKHAVKNLMNWS